MDLTLDEFRALSTDDKLVQLFTLGLSNKNKLDEIGDVRKELDDFKEEVDTRCGDMEKFVGGFDERLTKLEQVQKEHAASTSKRFTMNELYDKRFNLLFHGIKDNNVEEDIDQKNANVEYILDELLCIPDYKNSIKIIDTHRLPQQPVKKRTTTRNSRPVCRPIAIKVSCKKDVDTIFDHLKNLKEVNETRDANERIYCTKHLPKEMQRQRKAQMPRFRKAKKEEKDAVFKIDFKTGDYRLYVDNELIPLPKMKQGDDDYS